MKILCISDHRDPIVYSSQVKARFSDIDLVLAAGDLALEYYGFIVSSLNKPLLFVFGNHNLDHLADYRKSINDPFRVDPDPGLLKPSYGSTYIGGKVRTVNGIIVCGLGGSRKYNKGFNQFSEAGMFFRIIRLLPRFIWNKLFKGRYLDVLLTHAPPLGVGDMPDPCHRGFQVFRWFMRAFKPLYLIHGHVHLYDRNAKRANEYAQTKVINAYNHVLIEVDTDVKRPELSPPPPSAR